MEEKFLACRMCMYMAEQKSCENNDKPQKMAVFTCRCEPKCFHQLKHGIPSQPERLSEKTFEEET